MWLKYNGSVIVGRYDNEIVAAIAYNKAANLLKDKGFKRNYELNYIDELNETEYIDIFNKAKLSKKFLRLIASLSA